MREVIENRMVVESEWHTIERKYVTCARCGCRIYQEDETDYGGDCYEIDGEYYCDDCIAVAARDIFRVAI